MFQKVAASCAKNGGCVYPPKAPPLCNQQHTDSFPAACLQTSYSSHPRRVEFRFCFPISHSCFPISIFGRPFVFTTLQIPLAASSLFSHPCKTPGVSPQTHPCKA